MDYDLNESQTMLKNTAREFLSQECPKSLVKQMAKDERGYPSELWHKMANLGWLGLVFPEKYGGSDGNFLDLVVLCEEMGRACTPGPFFSTVVLGGMAILEAGDEPHKKALLPGIIDGSILVTLALIEPNGGQFGYDINLKAIANGDGYIINGSKVFVPGAHIANYIVCAARSEKGITLFLIDARQPGIKITVLKTLADDKQSEVVFNNVNLSKNDVLGAAGSGQEPLRRVLDKAAIAKCAEMVGGAQQVLEMTVDYVKQRMQFGRAVGAFQAVQHHCANMVVYVDTSRMLTNKAGWMLSEGIPCHKEVAMAKAWISDAYRKVTMLGHQCIGGVGFMEDHDLPLYSKRAKSAEIAFGDAEFNREVVATEMKL